MKNPFLVSLGQQIRSPMNSLIGVTESLLETDLTPAQRSMAEVARGSAEALLDVINDMVVLSGIRDGRMNLEKVNFDLVGMIGSVARLYAADAQQAGLELACRIDGEVPQNAVGDPGRLRQVLAALIGNAIKFTETGEVSLSVEVGSGEISPTLVRFTVRDTGIGIPPEKVRSILNEPGQICGTEQDSRWGGEGHGLAIAQLILLLMESRLEIESEPGRGSVFSFALELPRAESIQSDARRDDWLHLEGARVLAVCDSAAQRRAIGDMLGCAGMSVSGVGDAASALAALAETGPDPFQLVIIDSYLPGADCFDLAIGIHDLGSCAGLPLMVLSSGGQPGDGKRCRASGVSAYLSKPVSRIELLQASAMLVASGGNHRRDERLITRFSMEESRRARHILLVDDSPVNRQVAVTMLHRRGHQVDAFADAGEAARAMETSTYDCVLACATLDGVGRLCQEGAPAIIATVNPGHWGDEANDFAAGAEQCLVMPPEPLALFAAVERWGVPATVPEPEEPESERGEPDRGGTPVDMAALTSMMRDAGIEDAVGPILEIFRNDAPARMAALEDAASRGDAEDMVKAAHVFYSAAGSIKANDLAAILKRIEESWLHGDSASAAKLVKEARREYDAVESFLDPERRPALAH